MRASHLLGPPLILLNPLVLWQAPPKPPSKVNELPTSLSKGEGWRSFCACLGIEFQAHIPQERRGALAGWSNVVGSSNGEGGGGEMREEDDPTQP